jgi:hypothetical protein
MPSLIFSKIAFKAIVNEPLQDVAKMPDDDERIQRLPA